MPFSMYLMYISRVQRLKFSLLFNHTAMHFLKTQEENSHVST